MTDLMDLVKGQIGQGLLQQMTQQIGANDTKQTASAAEGILSTLMSAMARNASQPEGAAAINNALERDQHDSVLDNIMSMVGGNTSNTNRAANGAGMIKHMLGDRQSGAVDMISKMSGLDSSKTGNLMTMLAPVLMGVLSKQKRENNMGPADIAGLLSNSVQQQRTQKSNPMMDLANRFLDQDGDGSAMDDIAGMGMKILGGLFGKK